MKSNRSECKRLPIRIMDIETVETIDWNQLSEEMQSEYEDLEFDDVEFIEYRGWAYRLDDFVRIESGSRLKPWDAIINDTAFSGVLLRMRNDGTTLIGSYYV